MAKAALPCTLVQVRKWHARVKRYESRLAMAIEEMDRDRIEQLGVENQKMVEPGLQYLGSFLRALEESIDEYDPDQRNGQTVPAIEEEEEAKPARRQRK